MDSNEVIARILRVCLKILLITTLLTLFIGTVFAIFSFILTPDLLWGQYGIKQKVRNEFYDNLTPLDEYQYCTGVVFYTKQNSSTYTYVHYTPENFDEYTKYYDFSKYPTDELNLVYVDSLDADPLYSFNPKSFLFQQRFAFSSVLPKEFVFTTPAAALKGCYLKNPGRFIETLFYSIFMTALVWYVVICLSYLIFDRPFIQLKRKLIKDHN